MIYLTTIQLLDRHILRAIIQVILQRTSSFSPLKFELFLKNEF